MKDWYRWSLRGTLSLALIALAACGGAAYSSESSEEEAAAGGEGTRYSADEAGGDAAPAQAQVTTTTSATEPVPMVSASEEWNELLESEAALDEALELSTPACDDASDYLERLCELAERICEIADETGDSGARDRCTDGNARCARNRTAYDDACGD